jgi:uncharacterized protein (TIGR02679 family)
MVSGWLATGAAGRRAPLRVGPAGTVVPVPRLLAVLGHGPGDLRTLITRAGIDIQDTGAQRSRARRLRAQIDAHAAHVLPDAPLLTARLRLWGITEDTLAQRRHLIDALARIRPLLPFPRPVTLARLAHDSAGHPHYFDLNADGYGDLVVLLARDLLGAPAPQTPAEERALLIQVGIAADRLSQTVLVLGVTALGDGPTDRALNQAHADHRPIHLTLYDLTVHPPVLDPGKSWTVVENPSVVDEAMMRGAGGPIVCTSGTLTAVDHTLLALARSCSISVEYSGDLDGGGHSIAAAVHSRYQAVVRHMDEQTRLAASSTRPLPPLPPTAEADTGGTPPDPVPHPVYQEHPILLDLLLGPVPDDPLAALHAASLPASRSAPIPGSPLMS